MKDAAGAAGAAREHVTVIGAGIVGLASAAALVRSGRRVTVVDAADAVGQGTSKGNGCQLSYGYVAPLGQPGLPLEVPRLLLARHAPLRIVPRWDRHQWQWLARFLWACRAPAARRSTLELLALAQQSRAETERWIAGSTDASLCFARNGKFVLLPDAASLAKARAQMALQAGAGPQQFALSADACVALEPALARLAGPMAGAIHTPSECVVDGLALCRDLERRLRAKGVEFALGTRVQGFGIQGGRVAHLVTSVGTRPVDRLVLSGGAASAPMARQLGLSVPVLALKGYSITARIVDPAGVPKASVTDAKRKMVYAPIGDRLRVAGFVEVGSRDTRLDPARIDELVRCTREAFGAAVDLGDPQPWAGLRPATPTSQPIVRCSRLPNVFFNTGHGALGLTLAFGTAARLAHLMDSADAESRT